MLDSLCSRSCMVPFKVIENSPRWNTSHYLQVIKWTKFQYFSDGQQWNISKTSCSILNDNKMLTRILFINPYALMKWNSYTRTSTHRNYLHLVWVKNKVNFNHRSSAICLSHKLTNFPIFVLNNVISIIEVMWLILQRKLNVPLWVTYIP